MADLEEQIASTYSDYNTEGVLASGEKEPVKSEIRTLLYGILSAIDSVILAAALSSGSVVICATKADMDADLAHDAGVLAIVKDDASDLNNGIYVKAGASGSGSWSNTGLVTMAAIRSDIDDLQEAAATIAASITEAITASTTAVAAAATAVTANTQAAAQAALAQAAAEASGDVTFFNTYALALAGLSDVAENGIIEVMADETQRGRRTRYRKESGVYVFKLFLGVSPPEIRANPLLSFLDKFQNLAASDQGAIRRAIGGASVHSIKPVILNMNGDHAISQEHHNNLQTGIGATGTQRVWIDDGHQLAVTGAMKVLAFRWDGVSDLPGFKNCMVVTTTTAVDDADFGSNDAISEVQYIEGALCARLGWGTAWARDLVRYFWIRSSVAGLHRTYILPNDASAVSEASFTIDTPNTWQFIRIRYPACQTGTWSTDPGSLGMYVITNLAAANQANLAGTVGNTAFMTGDIIIPADYDVGLHDTRDVMPTLDESLARCQRYYQTSYPIGTAPGAGSSGGVPGSVQIRTGATTNYASAYVRLAPSMCTTPAIQMYSPVTGTPGKGYGTSAAADINMTSSRIGNSGFVGYVDNISVPSDTAVSFAWAADARIGFI